MTWRDHVLPLVYAILVCTAQHFGIPAVAVDAVARVVMHESK